ncbi:MAG: ABC transporter substrate-binding protein [Syntrophothermus sp.]
MTAHSAQTAATGPVTVRLSEVVRSVFYAPQYVALVKGFFEDEGLKIDLSTAWGADKGAAALVSGSVDIGFFGPEAAVYIYKQGAADYIVGFAQLTKRDGSFLMSRKPMPNFKWEDVKGKSIVGARKGGVPEMVLEWILRQHGLDPNKDVDITQNLAYTSAPGAFQAGVGEFIAQFEPTISQMEKAGVGYIVASLGVDGGEITYTVYHARKSFIQQHPDMLQKFTNAIYRGQMWVARHSPEEIAEVIAPFFPGTDQDVLIKTIRRYKNQDSWNLTPQISAKGFAHLQAVIEAAGELKGGPIPFQTLMTNRFADKAVAAIKQSD